MPAFSPSAAIATGASRRRWSRLPGRSFGNTGAMTLGEAIRSAAASASPAPIRYGVAPAEPTAERISGPSANPTESAATYVAIERARVRSSLSWLTQVSDSVNSASEAAPSTKRSGNHSQIPGMAGNSASTTAATTSAPRVMRRGPIRPTTRGRTGAIASTPSACMAALRPISDRGAPRSARSSAISDALKE